MMCTGHVVHRGCRTRDSAVGGHGAHGTGGNHGHHKKVDKLTRAHDIRLPWARLSPWALVFLLLLLPRLAYAAPSLEVDGNFAGYEDGEEYKGYVVVDAPDNYQSTLCLIGEYGKLVQITTEQYQTLSNPSTGGAFYELSQQWKKIGTNKSGTESYYPQWLALSEDFADGLVTVYGYGRVWAAVCTDDLKQQAKEDFNTILDGGSVDDGSSGEPDTDGTYVYINTKPNDIDRPSDAEVTVAGLAIPQSEYNKIYAFCKENSEFKLWIAIGHGADQNYATVVVIDTEPRYFFTQYNTWGCFAWPGSYREYCGGQGYYSFINYNGKKYLRCPSFSYHLGSYNNTATDSCRPTYSYYWGDINGGGSGSGGGSDEPSPDPWEPPTPSPDPPTNPTPPAPKDPITPDPPSLPGPPSDPVNPTPPSSPTLPTDTTHTADLQGILDSLSEHCIHIQTCLNSNFSGQNSYLGELFSTYTAAIVDQIYNGDQTKIEAINDVNNTIAQGFNDILEYWDEYVNWLDDKLDFKFPEVEEYDDTDLLSWIKKIYTRQGTGDVNTRPVDPATNYSGFAQWFGQLAGKLSADVSDSSLTSLSSTLGTLQHTFPFSLPWDIQQILSSLDASPVTPSGSITIPAVQGWWQSYSYDVDLHWLDSAMVPVRAFELLMFVLYCLVHTKDVFGYVVGD